MEVKTVYASKDGCEFDNKECCIRHEMWCDIVDESQSVISAYNHFGKIKITNENYNKIKALCSSNITESMIGRTICIDPFAGINNSDEIKIIGKKRIERMIKETEEEIADYMKRVRWDEDTIKNLKKIINESN